MLKAIAKLLEKRACHHEWDIVHNRDYEDQEPKTKWSEGRKAHTRMVLICKKCGKIEIVVI